MSYLASLDVLEALKMRFAVPPGKPIDIPKNAFDSDSVIFEGGGIRVDENTYTDVRLEKLPRTSQGLFDGCVVYICDSNYVGHNVDDLYKWHVDYCGTLEMMDRRGAIERYTAHVGASPDFLFYEHGNKNRSFYRQPRACTKCMGILSKHRDGYRNFYRYTVEQYLAEFSSPKEAPRRSYTRAGNAPSTASFMQPSDPNFKHNAYNPDFAEKALEHKRARPFCKHCRHRFALNDLNVHHINRKKHDDRVENWAVLCLLCHCIEHAKDNASMLNMEVKNGTMGAFLGRNAHKTADYLAHIERLPSYQALLLGLPNPK